MQMSLYPSAFKCKCKCLEIFPNAFKCKCTKYSLHLDANANAFANTFEENQMQKRGFLYYFISISLRSAYIQLVSTAMIKVHKSDNDNAFITYYIALRIVYSLKTFLFKNKVRPRPDIYLTYTENQFLHEIQIKHQTTHR